MDRAATKRRLEEGQEHLRRLTELHSRVEAEMAEEVRAIENLKDHLNRLEATDE